MASHRPGGGIVGKNVRQVRAPKAEPIPHKVNPTAVDQLGQALAHKPDALYGGRGYATPVGPTSNMGQGPGANRTLYGQSGTNQTYGAVRGPEADRAPDVPAARPGRDILSQFGPERKI